MQIKNGVMIVGDDDLTKSWKDGSGGHWSMRDVGFIALSFEASVAATKCWLVVYRKGDAYECWAIKNNRGPARVAMSIGWVVQNMNKVAEDVR